MNGPRFGRNVIWLTLGPAVTRSELDLWNHSLDTAIGARLERAKEENMSLVLDVVCAAASGAATVIMIAFNRALKECSRCHTRLPRVRWPHSFREAAWGGTTCPNCGLEFDRHGNALTD